MVGKLRASRGGARKAESGQALGCGKCRRSARCKARVAAGKPACPNLKPAVEKKAAAAGAPKVKVGKRKKAAAVQQVAAPSTSKRNAGCKARVEAGRPACSTPSPGVREKRNAPSAKTRKSSAMPSKFYIPPLVVESSPKKGKSVVTSSTPSPECSPRKRTRANLLSSTPSPECSPRKRTRANAMRTPTKSSAEGSNSPVRADSPKSVLNWSAKQSQARKHGQERCFPKLAKFVRPVHTQMKPTSLFHSKGEDARAVSRAPPGGVLVANAASPPRQEDHVWRNPDWWDYKDASICNAAKNVLHMSTSFETTQEEPKIRNEEWTSVKGFLTDMLSKAEAGSLYVSGVPGSGKSFIVQQAISSSLKSVFGQSSSKKRARVVHINCMTLRDPRRIFGILLEKGFDRQCTSSAHEKDPRYALNHLRKAASSGRKSRRNPGDMVVLVLDEVDHLYQNQGDVLYDLFSLAEMKNSNVVFVGIANSIDLTLRMLPHLHNIGVEPTMVNFRAYTHGDLFALMQERLHSLDGPVFDSKAVELCCRKIAASSGDMRQCLNAAYAALENYIAQRKASENPEAGKRFVDLQHMSLALGKCLKMPIINGMRALPQHQQMILCSIALLKDAGEVLLTSLFTKYTDLCKSTKICGLAFNEFENACTSLHDQGLVALNKKKNLHSKTLKLKVKMGDIVFALQGIRFFHNILCV
ncbi:putative cell division control protein [Chloropicon primus]|uniref:Putative cell division control protein n=1 Tax=Chloropicon primus TaxID=1764295 RepID=A0A5B8MKX3_9CHLO|nr:putative cell division control protein [Chloropicon primus]UPR00330.1 putative cell division control protein [Chloropicon primus]|eukprot:QDZ21116.1 putative cell division control protein [Chloropicon primus]